MKIHTHIYIYVYIYYYILIYVIIYDIKLYIYTYKCIIIYYLYYPVNIIWSIPINMAPLKTTTSPTPSPAVSLWRHLATLQVFLEPRVFFHVHVSIFTSKGWGKWLPHSIYMVNWRSYRKLQFLMGKSTIFMAIFNSYVYVKLPEGSGKVRWVTKLTKLLGDSNQWTVKVIFFTPYNHKIGANMDYT